MIIGFTMIKVQPGQEKAAYSALRAQPGINEIFRLYGEFSFFLILKCNTIDLLKELIQYILEMDLVSEVGSLMISSKMNIPEMALGDSSEPICS